MKIKEELNHHGIKYSKQREKLLSLLKEAENPLTIGDLANEVKDIDLSTIYRNLDMMVEKGLLIKTNHMEQNKTTYDYNRHDHRHYLICRECQRIDVLDGCPIHDYEHEVEHTSHYEITGHRLELYGVCPDCQKSHEKR